MIPFYKLEKLPRTQKLRKIAKVFTMAEKRLSSLGVRELYPQAPLNSAIFNGGEIEFFRDSLKMLSRDELFSADAKKEIGEASALFAQASALNCASLSAPASADAAVPAPSPAGGEAQNEVFTSQLLRAVNSIKHILLAETGKDQADWDFTAEDGRLDSAKRQVFDGMLVYLEDIRSPFNVGAMFRTAESFGVEKIYLSPFCADPNHRRAQRTAMGCTDILPWERLGFFGAERQTPSQLMLAQQESTAEFARQTLAPELAHLPIFALETGGIPLDKFPFPRRGLLIAGSEELGVSPKALAAADASLGRVSIPCFGAKASLNVSVAFGIALQKWSQHIASEKSLLSNKL